MIKSQQQTRIWCTLWSTKVSSPVVGASNLPDNFDCWIALDRIENRLIHFGIANREDCHFEVSKQELSLIMGASNLTYHFESQTGLEVVSSILELRIVKIVISRFQNKSWVPLWAPPISHTIFIVGSDWESSHPFWNCELWRLSFWSFITRVESHYGHLQSPIQFWPSDRIENCLIHFRIANREDCHFKVS